MKNTNYKRLILAPTIAIALAGPFLQLSMGQNVTGTVITGTSPSQNARSPVVLTNGPTGGTPASSQEVVDTQPQEVYLQDEHPSWVGWGYHYDMINGRWERRSPVASFSLPAEPDQASVFVQYRNQLFQQSSIDSTQSLFTLSAAIGLLRVGATFSQSSYSSEELISSAFTFSVIKDFGQLQEPSSVQFSSEVIDFLATHDFDTDPAGFRADWIDTFGEYIAIGTKMRARAELSVSLTDQSSAQRNRSFLDLMAEYGGVRATGSFVQLMERASRNQNLDVGLTAMDLPNCDTGDPSCPNISDLIPTDFSVYDTEQSREAYVDTLFDLIVPRAVGVVLVPVGNLAGIPEISVSDVDGVLLGRAVEQVQDSIQALMRSDRWVKPLSMRTFLQSHVQSATGQDLLNPILSSREVVVSELKDLWDATKSFLTLPTPEATTELVEAIQQMSDATTALDEATAPISAFIDTLPPIEIEITSNPNNVVWDGTSAFGMRPYRATISGIGLFTSGTHEDILNELKQGLRVHSTGWEYEIIECSPLEPHPFGGGTFGIESLTIISSETNLDGPTAGMLTLDVIWSNLSYGDDRQQDIVIEDHLPGHNGHRVACLYGTCGE